MSSPLRLSCVLLLLLRFVLSASCSVRAFACRLAARTLSLMYNSRACVAFFFLSFAFKLSLFFFFIYLCELRLTVLRCTVSFSFPFFFAFFFFVAVPLYPHTCVLSTSGLWLPHLVAQRKRDNGAAYCTFTEKKTCTGRKKKKERNGEERSPPVVPQYTDAEEKKGTKETKLCFCAKQRQ